jgi:glycosyltransferase involved in cell wall biosynthesis
MTSITEGWSLAVTEAMFFGLPMILTDTGGAAEVIENGDLGIIVPAAYEDPLQISAANLWQSCTNRAPSNLPAIISAIEDFYQRRDYWKQQGRLGREKVLAHYDVRTIAARHRCIIDSTLVRYFGDRLRTPQIQAEHSRSGEPQGAQLRAKYPQAVQ